MRPARLALAVTLLAAAAVPASAGIAGAADASSGWPQFGQGVAHLGVSPDDSPQPPYEVMWRYTSPTGVGTLSAPVTDGDVAVALDTNHVYGFDLATGERRWVVPRNGGSTLATPAIANVDGTPVLLFTQGASAVMSRLVAFSLRDANAPKLLWQEPLDDRSTTGVSVDGDTAYTADLGGEVVAVRIATGVTGMDAARKLLLWHRQVPGLVRTPPAASEGIVVVTSQNQTTGRSEVDAIGGDKHTIIWTKEDTAATYASAPTIDGQRVVVGFGESTGAGVMTALGLKDGLDVWSDRFTSPFLPFTDIPAADGYLLALGTRLGLEAGLYRVNAATGARVNAWNYGTNGLWSYEFDSSGALASPVVVGNTVVLALDDGRMAAIDTNTGVLVWKTDTGDRPVRGLAAGGGLLLASAGSRTGGLIAFGHDQSAPLLAEVSTSKPDWTRMLTNYAVAFAAVGLVSLGLGILARRRRRPGPSPDDDGVVDLPPEVEPA